MPAQTHPSPTLRLAFLLFAVGLTAVAAIFVLAAFNLHAPWLWPITMAFPTGFAVALLHTIRRR
ncbi:hypothetical protein [Actinokineospora inagensis]|uniref:hypothetical protein n=1 Tax=Actinokineospora inagensis TaxID=103730 RepID=UPI000409681C|nr:hypothetical protein [Actinokineospora inagensis]